MIALTMAQDTVDAALSCSIANKKKAPSIEALNSEMPGKDACKERGRRMLKTFLNRLRLKKCASATISRPDPSYKVAYLGNVITGWAKGDGCVEKPLCTLWRNYTQSSRPDVRMQLTVCGGGLRARTRDHGLTEYWAHRLTACEAPAQFPRLFCWVYRHEGRRLRHELRCHAVLCPTAQLAKQIELQLKHSLRLALAEFRRDKISRQNARLSLANCVYDNPSIPRRKILLSTGSQNYRPPLERSKSAPKLMSIEEIVEEEEDADVHRINNVYKKILRHYDSTSALLDKRKCYTAKIKEALMTSHNVPDHTCDDTKHNNNNFFNCDDKERLNGGCKSNMQHSSNFFSCDAKERLDGGCKSSMSDDLTMDEKSELILQELVASSMRNDLLESCERAWYTALGEKPDLIPPDSDEGSLSSGCESASTVTSDAEPPVFPTLEEIAESSLLEDESQKADVDFKVGGFVLARVRNFEGNYSNSDILKYCGMNSHLYNTGKSIINTEEVSLVPVGESQSDFSSLKVYKRRSSADVNREYSHEGDDRDSVGSEEENGSACSDESGYEEEELANSVTNIVLV